MVGQLAPLLLAGTSLACASAPRSAVEETRARFAEEHYCPIGRVAVAVVDAAPPAPPPIARDPERLAMWRRAATREPGAKASAELHARGCDEQAVFRCSSAIIGAHWRRRSVGYETAPICLEEPQP